MLDTLNAQFGHVDGVTFRRRDELIAIEVDKASAQATILLLGAQIVAYTPMGGPRVIWKSRESQYRAGKPVRGGIPICWPWFGDLDKNPEAVQAMVGTAAAGAHGFARNQEWTLVAVEDLGGQGIGLTLALSSSTQTRAIWPHEFELKAVYRIGPSLDASVQIKNTGDQPMAFTGALHSYLAVSGIDQASVPEFDGCEYIDTADGWKRKAQIGAIQITGETDRIYLNTPAQYAIEDRGWRRRILLRSRGSHSTVVWNPWIEKAKQLSTFADDEYREMVCIETANAADDLVSLAPGATHVLGVSVGTEML